MKIDISRLEFIYCNGAISNKLFHLIEYSSVSPTLELYPPLRSTCKYIILRNLRNFHVLIFYYYAYFNKEKRGTRCGKYSSYKFVSNNRIYLFYFDEQSSINHIFRIQFFIFTKFIYFIHFSHFRITISFFYIYIFDFHLLKMNQLFL